MRIWLLAENWAPRIGGIERYLEGIASNLTNNGHEVNVIEPTTYRFFYPFIPKWFPLYLFLQRKARRETPDVIIAGKALLEGRIALRLKQKHGIPYIVCTYGMEIATWSSTQKTKRQLQKVLSNSNHVIAINKKTKQELLELGVDEKKLSIMYPGIIADGLDYMNNSDDVLKKYSISQPYVLTVTRLVKRKGVDDLISAFTQVGHDNTSLVIVGDGPERKNLEQLAQELHSPVKFLGSISDDDIHALYSRARLFALTPKELPGDYEGFGIVYIEAGYFGLPVIGTRTGGVPEAVIDGETGTLAESGNIDSIRMTLAYLLDKPALATHYGEAGKKRVLEQFQWDKIIKQLEKIILTI